MNLKLSRHFQERMIERGINFDHVKMAIKNPEHKEDVFDGKILVRRQIDDKEIEVIYFKDAFKDRKEEYIIVTAYYLQDN